VRPVEHLLAVYFHLRADWPVISPLGRDPRASRSGRADFSRLVATLCDVGAALEALRQDHRDAILHRWSLWLSREGNDARIARTMLAIREAERERNTGRLGALRAELKNLRDSQASITSELRRHERRRVYIEAMERLEIELKARDLYARALMGPRAGV